NTYFWDETTLQYNFNGQKIQDFTHHYPCSTCSESDTRILTRYVYDSYYGRLTGVQEQIDNNSLRNIASYTYDDLGKVKSKNLGGVEQQDYTYNIRNQLASVNKDIFSSTEADKTFGLQLSYDYGFTEPCYDGNISGIQWKGPGAEPAGSYGYEYDAAGRLTNANYNQATLSGWSKSSTDYTMSNVTYDVNGNIISMKQMGTPGPGYSSVPVPIDELTYTYTGTGNQLQRVQDAIKTNYGLGDFQDITGTVDYTYDADGNLASDYNKSITGITYNEQDLPLSVTFYNGSTIKNLYDASGELLWKQVYNSTTGHTDIYHYWGGFNYRNDSLLFVLTDEGRARWLPDSNMFKYDFFVKDHLGNVRTVVTSDESGMVNYFADHELAAAGLESSMFANLDNVRDYKPGSPNPYDVMAAHLDGSDPGRRIGTAIAMSVMAGDKFDISATSYFSSDSINMQSAVDPNAMMNSIISSLVGGVDGYNQEATNVNAVNAMFSSGNYLGMYQGILDSISDYTRPLAYINYMVFDSQMNLVPSQSGAIQISGTPDNWQVIGTSRPITIGQNGYLSVYMSNADYMPVYMDKLNITYYKGRLVQEQHYYPFGLSINEGTAPGITNQYQYQDKKLQDELGLNLYDFHARQYDAQIGRFWGVDPADQFPSGYTGQGNDPANNIDPSGMQAGSSLGYPHEGPYPWSSSGSIDHVSPVAGTPWFDMGRYMDELNEALYSAKVRAWFNPPASAAQGKSAAPAAGSSSSNSGAGQLTETNSVYYPNDPEHSYFAVKSSDVIVTANKSFNFWKLFWASFKSGFRIFNWNGSTAGEQNAGDIETSSHADDAAGREPNLTTKATGTIYGIINIDYLMTVAGGKGGSGGVSQLAEGDKRLTRLLEILEGLGSSSDQGQEALDHIYGSLNKPSAVWSTGADGREQLNSNFDPHGGTHIDSENYYRAWKAFDDSAREGLTH
ncbi:MAG: RHS repeat-associated core domain-containing protein, partial [Flavipsychrobacter sp.]